MSELEAIGLIAGIIALGAAGFFLVRGFVFRKSKNPVAAAPAPVKLEDLPEHKR